MGSKYTKLAVAQPPKDLGLHGLDIVFIRSKIIGIGKKFKKSGIYFLTKEDLRWAFDLTDVQLFHCFNALDFTGMTRISCLDFWGALVLTGVDSVVDKINFCFGLMDLNGDGFLCRDDLLVLLTCIVRGIARMRGYELMPPDIVDKLVTSSFRASAKTLSDSGELHVNDFRSFILGHDHARAYLSALGTKVPVVDTSAIVARRSALQSEAASVAAEIARVMLAIEEVNEDAAAFSDRGGDCQLVRMSHAELLSAEAQEAVPSRGQTPARPQSTPQRGNTPGVGGKTAMSTAAPVNVRASLVTSLRNSIKGATQDSRDNKRQLLGLSRTESAPTIPANHPASKALRSVDVYADADVFSDSRACRPAGTSRNIFGDNFRSSLHLLWAKLMGPLDGGQSAADETVPLDEFALMALLENVGAPLSYHHARLCLREHLRPSQTGKYGFDDVLRWYQLYGSSAELLLSRGADEHPVNSYQGAASALYNLFRHSSKRLQNNLNLVKTQRSVLLHIDSLDGSRATKYPAVRDAPPPPVNSNASLSPPKSKAAASEQNMILKWVEFRNLCAKKPSTVLLRYFFGHPELVPVKTVAAVEVAAPVATGYRKIKAQASRANIPVIAPPTHQAVKLDGIDDWALRVQFSASSNPFTNLSTKRPKDMSRVKLLSDRPESYLLSPHVADVIEDYANLQAQDCLDFMNLRMEHEWADGSPSSASAAAADGKESSGDISGSSFRSDNKSKATGPTVYNSVVWFCVELCNQIRFEQEVAVVAALRNYFESIPFYLRKDVYSRVFVHGFNVQKEEKGKGGNTRSSAADLTEMMRAFVESAALDAAAAADPETASDEYFNFRGRRVVLVALYSEGDAFQDAERSLVESDVFVTRAVHKLSFELGLRQTLLELYAHAQKYEHYEERLYGPQEGELGEEGMDPLKFAKSSRLQKREMAEQIERIAAKTMPRDELLRLCKQYGCRDSGTVAEISPLVVKALQLQSELVGFGELSQFGRELIESLFKKFRSPPQEGSKGISGAHGEHDCGMALWDFNRLLAAAQTDTIYDAAEYKAVMGELEVLLDKSGNLRPEGLMNYYVNNGRVAVDNDLLGVGSLDEALRGKVALSSTFEPEALASLLSLVGKGNVLSDRLLQYAAYLSAVRDIKADGELESISELVALLRRLVLRDQLPRKDGSKAGDDLAHLAQLLKKPGWLASAINSLSEYLADGEEGVVPTMRRTALDAFGKFDRWRSVLSDELPGKVRFELAAMDEAVAARLLAEQAARAVRRQQEALAAAEEQQRLLGGKKAKVVAAEADAPQAGAEQTAAGAAAGEGEDALEVESAFVVRQRREALIATVVSELLPPLPEHNSSDLPAELLRLKEDLLFLSSLSANPTVELTLQESKQIAERRETFMSRIDAIGQLSADNDKLLAVHSCALYDCLRLFGKSISNLGAGSRDFCVRMATEGVDFLELLPEGLGEFAPAKQAYLDKVERAQNRKASALAALERERARRNMTDADREALRLEQLAALMKAWAAEEAQLNAEACDALFAAREERKSTAEIAALVAQWERLMGVKEERYPGSLQCAVSQSNVGCLLMEFYGEDHPRGAASVYTFQAAADILMTKARAIAQRVEEERAAAVAAEEEARLQEERDAVEQQRAAEEMARQLQRADGADDEDNDSHSVRMVNDNRTMSDGGDADPAALNEYEEDEEDEEEEEEEEEEQADEQTVTSSIMSVNSVSESVARAQLASAVINSAQNTSAATSTAVSMEPHEILPTIAILVNYITVLVRTESVTQLRQAFPIKEYVYSLLQLLGVKERERLDGGVISAVQGMEVLCVSKPSEMVPPVEQEVAFYYAEQIRRTEEERQKLIDAELAEAQALLLEESSLASSVVTTKSQKRREQKMKYAEQRRLDAAKRGETSRQRKALYELIQSDQITAIFTARASKVMLAEAPKWGSVADLELEQQDSGLGALAATLSAKPSVAKTTGSMKIKSSSSKGDKGGKSAKTLKSEISGITEDDADGN